MAKIAPDNPADDGGLRTPLEWALYLHRFGMCIIPVGGGDDGKKPPMASWKEYQKRRPTVEELRRWFADGKAGLAVIHGDISDGLICRDFDDPEAYHAWAAAYPDLAETLPTVATGRGFHVYARSTWRGYMSSKKLGDGELIANEKHYSILPPTVHKDTGREYKWLAPLPDTPDEMPVVDDPREAGLAGGAEPTSQRDTRPLSPAASPASDSDSSSMSQQAFGLGFASDSTTQRETERTACASLCEVPAVLEAVHRSLPEGPGQRNDAIFDLARRLKGLPGLAGLSARELRPVVELWHRLALRTITTKEFVQTWGDFCHAWQRAKYPVNGEYLMTILERARAKPVEGIEDNRLAVLAAMCRELQADAGNKPFFLGARDAARPFGVSARTACSWLWALVGDGYLVEVEKGGTAKGPRKATRWRYREHDRSTGTSANISSRLP